MNNFLKYVFLVISIAAILFVLQQFYGWAGFATHLVAFGAGGYLAYLHCQKKVEEQKSGEK